MSEIYPVNAATKDRALVDTDGYAEMYARSVDDNEAFWAEQAQRIDWIKPDPAGVVAICHYAPLQDRCSKMRENCER